MLHETLSVRVYLPYGVAFSLTRICPPGNYHRWGLRGTACRVKAKTNQEVGLLRPQPYARRSW
jgi:hypothetical protein